MLAPIERKKENPLQKATRIILLLASFPREWHLPPSRLYRVRQSLLLLPRLAIIQPSKTNLTAKRLKRQNEFVHRGGDTGGLLGVTRSEI